MAAIRALLGPTNTGKTHRAIEQMLQHRTGIMGLPLRLLAREVYDRLTVQVGEQAVALVTGEEKRIPPRARYWVCTVEAMPQEREADFVAVDEVQLAAHPQRGHVFTDRLLYARGRRETWFLGSATMRPLMSKLVPTAQLESLPRLSQLTDAGALPLSALPARTAVVAFSAARVYELAERLRLKRGGAAVVLGALSPRARNAQVALYQAGEVDYMVATDAIGMGLNMDVDCVAFSELEKFDGQSRRELDDAELAQIAGRAGRHLRDGRFATLEPLLPLPLGRSRAIERHRFPALEQVRWRNRDLELTSIEALQRSLAARPADRELMPILVRVDDAEDARALASLARRADVVAAARAPERIALLWQVCQIPDFRQLKLDDHFDLLEAVFLQLCQRGGKLRDDWVAAHIEPLANIEGDFEALLARLAAVRTWSYIAQHGQWVSSAVEWQNRAGAIEDRLSDALHMHLVQRFVETGSGAGRRRARRSRPSTAGSSLAEQLKAQFALQADEPAPVDPYPWLEEILDLPPAAFAIDEHGEITAAGHFLGRLARGADRLHPDVTIALTGLGAGARSQLHRRLVAAARDLTATLLDPLAWGADAPAVVRGLLYQLEQGLGTVTRAEAGEQIQRLEPDERRALSSRGVVVGRLHVFATALLKPWALRTRAALLHAGLPAGYRLRLDTLDEPAFPLAEAFGELPTDDLLPALGFAAVGPAAIRVDVLEKVAAEVAHGAPLHHLSSRLGCGPETAARIAHALRPPTRARFAGR